MYRDVVAFRTALREGRIEEARSCIEALDRLDLQEALLAAAEADEVEFVDRLCDRIETLDNKEFVEGAIETAWVTAFKQESQDSLMTLVEHGYQPPTFGADIDDTFKQLIEDGYTDLVRKAFPPGAENLPDPRRSSYRDRTFRALGQASDYGLIEYYARAFARQENHPEREAYFQVALKALAHNEEFDRVVDLYDQFGDRLKGAWKGVFNSAVKDEQEPLKKLFFDREGFSIHDVDNEVLAEQTDPALFEQFLDTNKTYQDRSILKAVLRLNDSASLKERAIDQFDGDLSKDDLSSILKSRPEAGQLDTLLQHYTSDSKWHRTFGFEDLTLDQCVVLMEHEVVKDPGRLFQNNISTIDEGKLFAAISALSDRPDALGKVLTTTSRTELLEATIEQADLDQETTVGGETVSIAAVVLLKAHSMCAPDIIDELRNEADVAFSDVPDEKLRDHKTYPSLHEQARAMGEDEYEQYRELFGEKPIKEAIEGQNPNYERARKLYRAGADVPEDANQLEKVITDGQNELVEAFIDESIDVDASVFYAATLFGRDRTFRAVAGQYDPKNATALRAANRILTSAVPIGRLGRLDWLEETHEDFTIDWNDTPTGSGELGMRPLQVVAGFEARTPHSGKSRREHLPDRIVAEALIERGADPGAGSPGDTALNEALMTDNTELFEWFLTHDETDIDLNDHPNLIAECIEKQYINRMGLLFKHGMEGPVEHDPPIATIVADEIDLRTGQFETILQILTESNIQVVGAPGQEALVRAFDTIVGSDQRERAVQNLGLLLQAQNEQGGVPTIPQARIQEIERHDDIIEQLTDYMRERQVKQLRSRGIALD